MEGKNEVRRGGGHGGGRGYGRGRGGGFIRDSVNKENNYDANNGFSGGYRAKEEGDAAKPTESRGFGGPHGSFRGGRRVSFSNGEDAEGERPRRMHERRSGTGRGNDTKRDGAGRANWGTPADEIAVDAQEAMTENDKIVGAEKQLGEENAGDDNKENPVNESEEKEPEEKEMTLEEYEKVLEEKRKALLALKTEERKVDLDKDFESMQQLSSKKGNDDIFIKLYVDPLAFCYQGSEKDKRKDADRDEKAKKAVSINEFLKPADGEKYYTGGRGRGRGGGPRGGFGGSNRSRVGAPAIEDQQQFPSLGAK
ncbi:hypothetical protein CJ030_MR4G008903 [Morella rubra]|uniref:Hyaluronan/mRNA-binding protein domain-containing protein n=1 Tax=Morella rubra TaxID=262757 RepID=A0A6A1VT72_9ROSI|nr:hypothetical protein CJ030_MR4G008903 [Morella rubra]